MDDDVQACRDFLQADARALRRRDGRPRPELLQPARASATASRPRRPTIQDHYLAGRKGDAAAAVPDALVDEIALVGDRARIADRLAAWRESGATTLVLQARQRGGAAGARGARRLTSGDRLARARRIYLMRHGAVSYFDDARAALSDPDTVPLTDEGRAQAEAARDLLAGIAFDRVIASGLPRTMETAAIVAPGDAIEVWPELQELRGDRLSSIPADELEEAFVHAFRGVVPNEKRFLGGETIGELFDRVLPALDRLLADDDWDTVLLVLHGAVNRAILSYALTGRADVPRPLRAGARVRQRPRRRRRTGSSARSTSTRPTRRTAPPARRRWRATGSATGRRAGDRPADGDGAGDAGPVGRTARRRA